VREDADAGVVVVAVEGEADLLGETTAEVDAVVAIDGGKAEVCAELADLLFTDECKALAGGLFIALQVDVAVHLIAFKAEAVEDARLGNLDDDGFAGGVGAGVAADPVPFTGDADALG